MANLKLNSFALKGLTIISESIFHFAVLIEMDQNVHLINPAFDELFRCSCCTAVLVDPYQLVCGDRICYSCMIINWYI